MKLLRFAILALLMLGLPRQGTAQVKRVFPKTLKGLSFGMPMAQFSEDYRSIDPQYLKREDFRYRWEAPLDGKKGLTKAVYYFDDGPERPFYEVILSFEGPQERDAWLRKYYGAPNANNATEWRFPSEEGFEIRAWCYQNRLVIAALLPGTEWEGS